MHATVWSISNITLAEIRSTEVWTVESKSRGVRVLARSRSLSFDGDSDPGLSVSPGQNNFLLQTV